MPMNDYSYTIIELINNAIAGSSLKPLNLGGIAGSGGGSGGPVGGFTGVLPQTRVAYDLSELAISGIPVSGESLVDNLNHIRYRVNALETHKIQRTSTWVLSNPAVGGVPGPRVNENYTNVRVDGYVVGSGSVTLNIESRSGIGVVGTNLFSSDVEFLNTGTTVINFGLDTIYSGYWLWMDISNISGIPNIVTVTLVCET